MRNKASLKVCRRRDDSPTWADELDENRHGAGFLRPCEKWKNVGYNQVDNLSITTKIKWGVLMSKALTSDQHKIHIQDSIGQHFVSLRGVYRNPNDAADPQTKTPFNFSGFVYKLRDDWFFLTAGHVLEQIAAARKAGMIVENFLLDDAYSPNAPFKSSDTLIPFNFDDAPKHFINQPEIGDFGLIWISPYYRDLLSKNKITPFVPEETSDAPYDPGFINRWVIGLPEELMRVENTAGVTHHKSQLVIVGLSPLRFEDLPEAIKSDVKDKGLREDNFFAQVPDASELSEGEEAGLQDILGLSGGPIIGWRRNNQGIVSYSILAIQSSWWPSSRVLMAGPITRYISAIDRTIQSAIVKMNALLTSAENNAEVDES